MASVKKKLFTPSLQLKQDQNFSQQSKVSIIGNGKVATTIAFSLLLKGISNHVVMIDKSEEKVKAEGQDLLYGLSYFDNQPKIQATSDFSSVHGSKIVIFAIDVRKIEGEDFFEFLQRNVDVYKATVPNVVQFCSDGIFILVSATCDILSCKYFSKLSN